MEVQIGQITHYYSRIGMVDIHKGLCLFYPSDASFGWFTFNLV
jgi:hypothetical protein